MLRLISLQLALVSLAALSACATDTHAAQDAARAACQDQHVSDADMQQCIEQMQDAIAHSSTPQPPPPHVPSGLSPPTMPMPGPGPH